MSAPDARAKALTPGRPSALTQAAPFIALMGSMASIHTGAALAQSLFPKVGAEGATALRVGLAAVILLAIRRPSPRGLTPGQWRMILLYGVALGAMNLLFYQSLRTVPLGVAVAVEFTGPLLLSACSHRSKLDIVWVLLAGAGFLALAPIGGARALDPLGLAFALGAGGCWALYIVFGQRAGAVEPGAATAFGMTAAAVVAAPFGLLHAGAALFNPALLPLAFAVAVLSSAVPYSLEMFALVRLPRATFGTLMSLEPAVGALAGWLILGQHLDARQILAITAIILASGGAAATWVTGRRKAAETAAIPLP